MSIQVGSGSGGTISLNTGSSDYIVNINDSGGSMASRSGPVIININIDDDEGIFGLIGRGLIAVENEVPTDKEEVDVYLGQGLVFGPADAKGQVPVMVQAGTGLGFDTLNNLVINLGDGLIVNDQNQITTDGSQANIIGDGLVIDATTGLIDVDCGNGLQIGSDNSVGLKISTGLDFASDGSLVATGITPSVGQGIILGVDGDIEVNAGTGLGFAEDGSLVATAQIPAVGAGLVVDANGDIDVNVGQGLVIGAAGDVEVNIGQGLDIAEDGSIFAIPQLPPLGTGLTIDTNGRLSVDNTQPGINQSIKVLTDTQFSFKDSVLYIAKVFTTYTVVRSNTGAVVSLDVASTSIETDTVAFSNGYGLPFGPAVPNRVTDPTKPNFYKK